jgi:hypothetical protein
VSGTIVSLPSDTYILTSVIGLMAAWLQIVKAQRENTLQSCLPKPHLSLRSAFFITGARGDELGQIGKFSDKGMLKATGNSVRKLEDFEGAFAKTASGPARGKVVFKIAEG